MFESRRPDYVKVTIFVVTALAIVASARPSDRVPQGASAFRGTIERIDVAQAKRMTGVSWRRGCPVALRDLRLLRLTHWGFDGRVRTGRLIVHRDVARDLVEVFRDLYAARFPIRRMVLVDAYGGSDYRSIEADNTSAFNCRFVERTTRWSNHAYGTAIDVNPIENPTCQAVARRISGAGRTSRERRDVREWRTRAAPSYAHSTGSAGAGEVAGRR